MSKKKSRSPRKAQPANESGWTTWWGRLSERHQHTVAALTLVAVSIGFFAPIHFSSQKLIPGDTVRWISMANAMMSYEQQTGEPALWSPNTFGGMPGTMVYYPDVVPQIDVVFGLLRSILWPSSHFLLLLFGMYLLTWYLTREKLAGLFSSIAFGLTTYIPVFLTAGHNTKFVAVAWAPWLLLAFIYAVRKPSLKASLLFALALAVNLRADHVQITYYTLFVIAIWWVVEAIHAHRVGGARTFWTATGWLALGSVMAFLMIAQPYLAQLEYKQYSIRGQSAGGAPGGMSWEYAMAWSQGFGELLTLLVADAFGGGTQYYWGPKSFTGGPHYFGALTVVLGVFVLTRKRDATTWAMVSAAVVMVLFSLGENFAVLNRPMFEYFPLFDAFRVPETWLVAVAMVGAVLAGKGLSELISTAGSKSEVRKSAYITFGVATGLLAFLLLFPDAGLDFERVGERSFIFQQVQAQNPGISESDPRVQDVIGSEINRRKDERRSLFAKDAQRSVLFLLFGLLVVYLFFRGKIPGWLAGWAFVVLILLDLGGVGRRYLRADILTNSDEPSSEVVRTGFDDFILGAIEKAGGSGHLRVLSFENDMDPSVNARPSFFYESLGGYHGAKLRLYQDYLDHILFNPRTQTLNPAALDIMNVKYVVGRRAVPGYEMVYQDDVSGNTVFENPSVLPRAFFASQVEVIETSESTWDRLAAADFDPASTVLLTRETGLANAPIDTSSVVRADLVTFSPREIEFDVSTDEDRWLVISEVYYPAGWTATIDDNPAPIERADYLLRAVHVTKGQHRIRLRFDPASHVWGVRLSLFSTLLVYGGLLVLLVPGWIRRRGVDGSPDPSE